MEEKKSYFEELYAISVNDDLETKGQLKYLNWGKAISHLKTRFPDAYWEVAEQEDGTPWFVNEKSNSGWVAITLHIPSQNVAQKTHLAIMDMKNQAVTIDKINSVNANKSIRRCIVKGIAETTGLGLYVYSRMSDTEDNLENAKLKKSCMDLITSRSALSETAKAKVADACTSLLSEENGDPRLCEDNETLETLKKRLLAIRK